MPGDQQHDERDDEHDLRPVFVTAQRPGEFVEAESVEAAQQWDDRVWRGPGAAGGWLADPGWSA